MAVARGICRAAPLSLLLIAVLLIAGSAVIPEMRAPVIKAPVSATAAPLRDMRYLLV
jgi:hypothetical protein